MESDEEDQRTETEEDTINTPEEQKKRLIQAFLTSTMEKEETAEEQNERRKLIHAYSKRTIVNKDEQIDQDKTDMYLRTSLEEEQKPSTWEEYDEEEPFEEYDEDECFKENGDEGRWTTQFSYLTEEEENTLFIAFMTGNVEDQKTWINAKMNLAKATTNEEIRRREEEILNRIIPTEIVDLDKAFEEKDEEETDDPSERQPYDLTEKQEEDYKGKFIDEDEEDEEAIHPLSLTTELDDQLERAKYFTKLDIRWKCNNERIVDEDQWKENFETNQVLFEPTTIFSCPYSPTISQTMIEEIFQDKQNDLRIIVNRDYDILTKEEDTEDTRSVPRQTRDNDLFTEPGGYTSRVTRTEYEGLLNPENQLQTDLMKLYGIDICPTPAMITEVKSFLGLGNVDKGFIQDNWTLTEPFEELLETDETLLVKKDKQDDKDMIMLPGDLFPNSLDYGFDNERTLEIDDGQSDPIKRLSVHGLKTLRNHFSKDTAATSVNDVIAVNVTNTNPLEWIMMAQDMDITVNDAVNILLGKRDGLKDWLVWILRSPNKNTTSTDRSTLQFSKMIQILNGKQARQSLFLSERPNRYTEKDTDNQNKILLPNA